MSADHQPTVDLYRKAKEAAITMEAGRDLPGEKLFISSYVPVFDLPDLPEIPKDQLPHPPKSSGTAQRMGYRNRSADGMPPLEALMDAFQPLATPQFGASGGKGKPYIFGHSVNSALLPKLFQVRREEAGGHFKWGDKILVSTPIYSMLPRIAYESGLNIIAVPATKADGYKPNPKAIKAALKEHPDARAFLIVNPNNPTGTVLSQPEVDAIGKVIADHNEERQSHKERELIVVEDTTFAGVRWERSMHWPSTFEDRQEMGSFLGYLGTQDNTISLHSWSKDFSPELGMASATGNPALLDGMRLDDGPTKHTQEYALRAIHPNNKIHTLDHMIRSTDFYKHDYDVIKTRIEALNTKLKQRFELDEDKPYVGIVTEPAAGFHVTVDFSGLRDFSTPQQKNASISTSLDFAMALMKKTNVIAYPGEMFYIPGEDMTLRLSLNVEEKKLNKALDRIEEFCLSLKPPSKWANRDTERRNGKTDESPAAMF